MSVRDEVKEAYADCWMEDYERSLSVRQLNFRAGEPVSPSKAKDIMDAALDGGGYNDFDPCLLYDIPEDRQVILAREGSVAIYVDGEELDLGSDEVSAEEIDGKTYYRYWWD